MKHTPEEQTAWATAPSRRSFVLALTGALAAGAATRSALATSSQPHLIEVFKTATCGCCGAWVDHLKANGFQVKVNDVADTAISRKQLGMPEKFGRCHTARVGGYVVEGHVPAQDIKRLLATRPVALGLAVPGMPVGSPGMEDGSRRDAFQVLLIDRRGQDSVFASYPAARAAAKPART